MGGPSKGWAFAGVAIIPNDDNNRKAKIPVSKCVLLIFTEFLFNIFLPYFVLNMILNN